MTPFPPVIQDLQLEEKGSLWLPFAPEAHGDVAGLDEVMSATALCERGPRNMPAALLACR